MKISDVVFFSMFNYFKSLVNNFSLKILRGIEKLVNSIKKSRMGQWPISCRCLWKIMKENAFLSFVLRPISNWILRHTILLLALMIEWIAELWTTLIKKLYWCPLITPTRALVMQLWSQWDLSDDTFYWKRHWNRQDLIKSSCNFYVMH